MAAGEPPIDNCFYQRELVRRTGNKQDLADFDRGMKTGLKIGAMMIAGLTPADTYIDAGELVTDLSNGDFGGAVLSGLALVGLDFIKDAKRIIDAADEVKDVAKTADKISDAGRKGKQARLKEIVTDDKASSADKGWIKSEMNQIDNGKRKSIRNPPGKEMAHERGREAAKGYSYEHSNLQDKDLHKLQHKYDKNGTLNKERPINK